jgi:hypothetical protein
LTNNFRRREEKNNSKPCKKPKLEPSYQKAASELANPTLKTRLKPPGVTVVVAQSF